MPEIVPRVRRLFSSGFGYIAFLMASIYGMVRLLPPGHPYLNPQNIGRFGIRHAITEASNNLVLSRRNIDQILIYAAMLAAVVILVLQFAILIYAFLLKPALAMSLFNTPSPAGGGQLTDIAFVLMDNVFGLPGVFCNNATVCTTVAGGAGGAWPTTFHIALQNMFRFYSMGMLLIAVLIFLYFVTVVIAETATTGHPFGQRFQSVWVPLRLVVAMGLLVPINFGMNSGQYIALYAAKAGSGFATNAWRTFNNTITASVGAGRSNPSGEVDSLLAIPNPPDVMPVLHFMSLVHACAYSHWRVENTANTTTGGNSTTPPAKVPFTSVPLDSSLKIKPYFVKKVQPIPANQEPFRLMQEATDFAAARQFYNNSDIIIRFGRQDDAKYPNDNGAVEPTCGEIRIKVVDLGDAALPATAGGAYSMQVYYFDLIKSLWYNAAGSADYNLVQLSQRLAEGSIGRTEDTSRPCFSFTTPCADTPPTAQTRQDIIDDKKVQIALRIQQAWTNFNTNNTSIALTANVLDLGWGGAGIWYNTINRVNGAFVSAVAQLPAPTLYPLVMEQVKKERGVQDAAAVGPNQFCLNIANAKRIELSGSDEARQIAQTLCNVNRSWTEGTADQGAKQEGISRNAFEDIIHLLLGTNGLFQMRRDNAAIHPMAQLAAVGKSLVDSAILNIVVSTGFNTMGGLMGLVAGQSSKVVSIIGSLGNSIAFLGLTAGFVLFYILPFLPFLYMIFAVGSWLKTIFEAMVGIPLWALAHLRLDGDGLPGDAAANGYYLIFEIFIRPILTIFALVAAVLIFTAQVRVLNFIWGMVVDNITGYDVDPLINVLPTITVPRGAVDQFFFTIIYTIIVYMLATASFKLIDKLPDNILRWLGAGVSSFGDINEDPTQSLTKYAAVGGMTIGKQATEGLQQFGKGIGDATAGEIKRGTDGVAGSLGRLSDALNKKP